jgi:hypothetical protein
MRCPILLCLFLCLTVFVAVSATAQDLGCGTVLPQAQIRYELARIASGLPQPGIDAEIEAVSVPLTVHIIRSSTGSGGLTAPELNQAMADLNALYVSMDITFYICGAVDYIDDDSYYLDMSTDEQIDGLRQVNVIYGTINVYFVPNSSGFPYCGLSSFTGSAIQGIVMNNGCTGTASPSTLAHEIGHYFNLYHTHETAFGTECPDGSNCSAAGDLLCDTPADPNLSGHVSAYPGCAFDNYASTPGGCSGTYNPQVENIMSYSTKACRDFWSADQIAKAVFTLNNDRTELLPGCSPFIENVGHAFAITAGDADPLIEAGETFELDATIKNIGSNAANVNGTLTTSDGFVSITTGSALFGATVDNGAQASTQTPFEVSISGSCPNPHIVAFDLDVTADGSYSTVSQLLFMIGDIPGFADDVESGEGYWTHNSQTAGLFDEWHIDGYRSHSPSSSWKVGGLGSTNYADGLDAALITQPLLLSNADTLSFWHWIDAEPGSGSTAWDGGIVMISEGGGAWTQILPVGGYPYTIIDNPASPFAGGTPCYSGSQSWSEAKFDLSAYSGVVQIMFRFGSDAAVNEEGWYVDDISVAGSSCADTDGDGQCDDVDSDDDNDGVADGVDSNPIDPFICEDADGDGCDDCSSGADGYGPLADNFTNNDGPDTDGDGLCDSGDPCTDLDGDGFGDPGYSNVCDEDNCPSVPNPGQENTDGTGPGDACCCINIRGNANCDPEDKINVADLTYSVDRLFGLPLGQEPPCPAEGNVNGDPEEKLNIADVTFLVAYLFGSPAGPPPPACP